MTTTAHRDLTDVRRLVLEHHRNCLPGLARLRTAATEDSAIRRVGELRTAMGEVLGQLRAAEDVLAGTQADPVRRASLTRFLACRLKRLDVAAEDALAAGAAGDVAVARRLLYQFHALATALWQVQLGVLSGTGGPVADRRHRVRHRTAAVAAMSAR